MYFYNILIAVLADFVVNERFAYKILLISFLKLRFNLSEEVCFEIHRVFAKEDHLAKDVPQASLVWLGDESSRPKYAGGQNTTPMMTEAMDEKLWEFVGSKQMDVKMFKALVEGRLPPKEKKEKLKSNKVVTKVETPDGNTIEVDDEDLAQAALFKQMKTQFGKDALMKAMLQLVKQTGQDSDSS